MKRTLLLGGNKVTTALKKELNDLIRKGELKIYFREWYLNDRSEPVGVVKSIRFNDKKKTNTLMVQINSNRDGWAPEYNLVRSMVTNKLHINLIG